MSTTVRLVPSTYAVSNSQYVSVTNPSNAYANVDSTTYATCTSSRASTTTYYVYLRGFDFTQVPDDAIIESITVKVRGYESGLSTSTNYVPRLCNGTSAISNTSPSTNFGTSAKTIEIPIGSLTWDSIVGYGENFGVRVSVRRSSSNTQGYLYVYGAEIEVTYSAAVYHDVTLTNTTSATVAVSEGHPLDGTDVTVTADTLAGITVTDNGVDVTSQFAQAGSGSTTQTAGSFTTALSSNNANFYTGSNSTGNYFNYAVGHTAESPGSTSTSYNTYVKDNSQNTATGWAIYSFDFSDIPADATITGVTVKVYGACEDTTHDSTHKAEVSLYSGDTQKGTTQNFSSTSNSVMTVSDVGTWTRAELQDAKLRFTVAYYGGRCFGITWTVAYESSGYAYVIEAVAADHAIVVSAASGGPSLYVKSGGAWAQVARAYRKVSGGWQQVALSEAFDSSKNYVRG